MPAAQQHLQRRRNEVYDFVKLGSSLEFKIKENGYGIAGI